MKNNLALLHRYTLVRIHVKIGDHLQAAKLLIKVAANISQFPARKLHRIHDRIIMAELCYFTLHCQYSTDLMK